MSAVRPESAYDRLKDAAWWWLFEGYRPLIAACVLLSGLAAAVVGLGYFGVDQARKSAAQAIGQAPDTPVALFAPAILDALGCVQVACPDASRTTAFLASRSPSRVMQVVLDGQSTQLVPGTAGAVEWSQFAQAATLSGAVSSQTIQVDPGDARDVARFTVTGTPWRGAMTFTRDEDGLRLDRVDYTQERIS